MKTKIGADFGILDGRTYGHIGIFTTENVTHNLTTSTRRINALQPYVNQSKQTKTTTTNRTATTAKFRNSNLRNLAALLNDVTVGLINFRSKLNFEIQATR